MLSYRHAFHAGNHADVLKHLVLVQLTRYFSQKDKPFTYIDTHSGAGAYALNSGYATKLAEHKNGIARLWERTDLPPAVADYVELVRQFNPDSRLTAYPGSPFLAFRTMRKQDRLRLFELHGKDARLLQENLQGANRQAIIEMKDGFAGLKASLPPPSRRAVVLVDPAYEDKHDYERVYRALKESVIRFPSGTYALWYPQLTRLEAHELPQRLKRLPVKRWLHAALRVRAPADDGIGMHGSGMFIVNPPWILHDVLVDVMPYLVSVLGQDTGANFTLEQAEG